MKLVLMALWAMMAQKRVAVLLVPGCRIWLSCRVLLRWELNAFDIRIVICVRGRLTEKPVIPSIISIWILLSWKVLNSCRCLCMGAPFATSGVLRRVVSLLSRLRHRLTMSIRLLVRRLTSWCIILAPIVVFVVRWQWLLGLVSVQITWLDLGRAMWTL